VIVLELSGSSFIGSVVVHSRIASLSSPSRRDTNMAKLCYGLHFYEAVEHRRILREADTLRRVSRIYSLHVELTATRGQENKLWRSLPNQYWSLIRRWCNWVFAVLERGLRIHRITSLAIYVHRNSKDFTCLSLHHPTRLVSTKSSDAHGEER
jgi:hypothetical protein